MLCILDYSYYGQLTNISLCIGNIPDPIIIFILIKHVIEFLFAYVAEFAFFYDFSSFFARVRISFLSPLIISVVCSFRFAQNYFIESLPW